MSSRTSYREPVKDLDESDLTYDTRTLQQLVRDRARDPASADRETLRLLETYHPRSDRKHTREYVRPQSLSSDRARVTTRQPAAASVRASSSKHIAPTAELSRGGSDMPRDACLQHIEDRDHPSSHHAYANNTSVRTKSPKDFRGAMLMQDSRVDRRARGALKALSVYKVDDRQSLAKLEKATTDLREDEDASSLHKLEDAFLKLKISKHPGQASIEKQEQLKKQEPLEKSSITKSFVRKLNDVPHDIWDQILAEVPIERLGEVYRSMQSSERASAWALDQQGHVDKIKGTANSYSAGSIPFKSRLPKTDSASLQELPRVPRGVRDHKELQARDEKAITNFPNNAQAQQEKCNAYQLGDVQAYVQDAIANRVSELAHQSMERQDREDNQQVPPTPSFKRVGPMNEASIECGSDPNAFSDDRNRAAPARLKTSTTSQDRVDPTKQKNLPQKKSLARLSMSGKCSEEQDKAKPVSDKAPQTAVVAATSSSVLTELGVFEHIEHADDIADDWLEI